MRSFTIPVGYTSYEVVTRKTLVDDGECDFANRRIVIKPKDHKDAERSTIYHEWVHALMHEYGYAELCKDEAFVESLAIAIMRVREEVPWL